MRGTYYSGETTEDKNARENTAKQAQGEGPQVFAGPDTVAQPADVRAIVAFVAHSVLQNELDWSESDLRQHSPSLQGLTREQIEQAIAEARR